MMLPPSPRDHYWYRTGLYCGIVFGALVGYLAGVTMVTFLFR